MDQEALVNILRNLFLAERANGLVVDGMALAPAYGPFMNGSYVVALSAPSLADQEYYERMYYIINLIHDKLPVAQRRGVNRVRVFSSLAELKKYMQSGFDGELYDETERSAPYQPDLLPV